MMCEFRMHPMHKNKRLSVLLQNRPAADVHKRMEAAIEDNAMF